MRLLKGEQSRGEKLGRRISYPSHPEGGGGVGGAGGSGRQEEGGEKCFEGR